MGCLTAILLLILGTAILSPGLAVVLSVGLLLPLLLVRISP